MRSFTTLLASATLLATSALAATPSAPGANWGGNWGPWTQSVDPATENSTACMSEKDAQTVANTFEALIHSYSDALANASLSEDFHDYSDSVIELINSGCDDSIADLGNATFNSLTAFEKGQGSQPSIPFQQLNVWHACDVVTLRWVSEQDGQQVTGIIVLETEYSNNKWLIQNVYSEFNSGAWLVNLGVFKPHNCTTGHHP